MTLDLSLVWAAVIGFAVFMYVMLDGFDLGLGVLFPFAPGDADRDVMMNSVAPVWDGNETWLVLGGVGLLAAFPKAYAALLPALYLPVLLMLIALIFRGVAFEFRFKAHTSRWVWDVAFAGGSLAATFAQGLVLGAFVRGIALEDGRFVGGPWDWLGPFPIFVGLALVVGYALLGACWLILRTEGPLQEWAFDCARVLAIGLLLAIAAVSAWTPLADTSIAARWFSWPNPVVLWPVPVLTAILAWALLSALARRREIMPFVATLGLFALAYLGLGISLFPQIVPPSLSIWEAAAAPNSQAFALVGVGVMIPVVLVYTVYVYWVFRGKMRHGEGYH